MDLAYYYELWRGMMLSADPAVADAVAWWQEFYVKFYMAFIEADRWKQYLDGIGTTLDRHCSGPGPGRSPGRSWWLWCAPPTTSSAPAAAGTRSSALFNGVCKVYVTVIRGTPMMVQLLIWSSVVFVSSRNFTQVGILGLGINSGAYVAEIIRGGLMAVDGGQMEAGRSLGLNYFDTMRFIVIPQAIQGHPPRPGQRVHHPAQGYLLDHGHRRQGAALRRSGHHGPYLRGNVPSDRHRLHVSGSGHDLHLASGQAGKEAASK